MTGQRTALNARWEDRVRRWLCLTLLAVCLLGLAGCGEEENGSRGDGGPPPDAGRGTLTIPERPIADVLGEALQEAQDRQARAQKVLRDAEGVAPLLNAFWAEDLRSLHKIDFDPPDRFEYYSTTGNSPCGGVTENASRNAYYCPQDDSEHVGFDLDWFQEYLEAHPGGATTFLVLAHEWGHAVQDSWLENGGDDVWDPPYRKELNADCLAGVFLARSIAAGSILAEEGDAEAIFSWLYEAGSANWLDPATHGTRAQRMAAFEDGVLEQDSNVCRQRY